MIIDAISDLHGYFPELPGGDILILGGDYTASHTPSEFLKFYSWLTEQKYRYKVMISGNHDESLECSLSITRAMFLHHKEGAEKSDCIYLCDNSVTIEGIKIYGSPWTQWFKGINPKCCEFVCHSDEQLADKWELIPGDADIVVTHSPMYMVLDETAKGPAGSLSLRSRLEKVKPTIHICGHIHEGHGSMRLNCSGREIICYNVSLMNEYYEPVHKVTRIEIYLIN